VTERAATPQESPRCKRIIALLGPDPRPGSDLCEALERIFGPVEYKGEPHPFDVTEYYRDEFGPRLHRSLWCFRGVDGPERLPDLKHAAAGLERLWSQPRDPGPGSEIGGEPRRTGRKYNLDIGYMDPDKVVLASFKPGPCKLYLRDGVYADLLLKYSQGRFDPMPWAFSDFQDGRYQKSLLVIREKLKSDLRKDRASMPGNP
jgi:hypothetical protein